MLCQQIVEVERRGQNLRILRSIATTLRKGDELISERMMTRAVVLEAAQGQIQSVTDQTLSLELREIFNKKAIRSKSCHCLAQQVEEITLSY